ncbi:MAG TPA: endonuclease III [Longimicrobiales bacterium]|nr:endonuclease III [Longimicrobiales bacterium]
MAEGAEEETLERGRPPVRDFGDETREERRERARRIYELLAREYPDATVALRHDNPYELAVATILSAQTTDERVNEVTPELFRRYPTVEDLAEAEEEEVQEIIRSTGFFRNKAKNIVGMARGVVEDHDSEIPRTMEELTDLPGIGRKTANVILGNAFGIDEGVVVDTHVKRLSGRLGFTEETSPVKVERDLIALFPKERWTMLAHYLIWHGRAVCDARSPECHACALSHLCPSSRAEEE